MRAFSIKTILHLKTFLTLFFFALSLGEASAQRPNLRKKTYTCRRGTLKFRLVDGKRRPVCVVKKTKKAPQEKSLAGPLTWSGTWWGRLAGRTDGYPTLASNRYRAYLEGQKPLSPAFKAVFGGRVTHDVMPYFQSKEDYRDDFSRNKRPDWELWDAYIEYRKEAWRVRVGQQQVAWGEAFGFFYADIINPKDLRERNLGRLYELRLPVPMANVQWSTHVLNAQLLWLPFFRPNRMPYPQSNFFPSTDLTQVKIMSKYERDDSPGDLGARLSGTVKGVDLSILHFNHIDRTPYYQIHSLSPAGLVLRPYHERIQTWGMTFSSEIHGYVIRGENIYTPSRKFNTQSGFNLEGSDFSQRVHVLGLDLPKFDKLMLSFQGSIDSIDGDEEPMFREKEITLASIRVAYDLPSERQIEVLSSTELKDFGHLLQLRYLHPLTSSHEFESGVDLFSGKENTFFGQAKKASRLYIGLRGAFNG